VLYKAAGFAIKYVYFLVYKATDSLVYGRTKSSSDAHKTENTNIHVSSPFPSGPNVCPLEATQVLPNTSIKLDKLSVLVTIKHLLVSDHSG
jgi:hypothetical protein